MKPFFHVIYKSDLFNYPPYFTLIIVIVKKICQHALPSISAPSIIVNTYHHVIEFEGSPLKATPHSLSPALKRAFQSTFEFWIVYEYGMCDLKIVKHTIYLIVNITLWLKNK